jgi:hypothetical protein
MSGLFEAYKKMREEAQMMRIQERLMSTVFKDDEPVNPYTGNYDKAWSGRRNPSDDVAKLIDERIAPLIRMQEERAKEEEMERRLRPLMDKFGSLDARLAELNVARQNATSPAEANKIDLLAATIKESQMQTALNFERALKDFASQRTGGFDLMQFQQMRMEDERARRQQDAENERLKLQMIDNSNKASMDKMEMMMEMMRGNGKSESEISSFVENLKLMKELGVMKGLTGEETAPWERALDKFGPHVPETLKQLKGLVQANNNAPGAAQAAPAADSQRRAPSHRQPQAQQTVQTPVLPALRVNEESDPYVGDTDCPGCGSHITVSIEPGQSTGECSACHTKFDLDGRAYFSPHADRIRRAAGAVDGQPVPPGTLQRLQHSHGSPQQPGPAQVQPVARPQASPPSGHGPSTRVLYPEDPIVPPGPGDAEPPQLLE